MKSFRKILKGRYKMEEKYLMVFDDLQEWEEWSRTHLIVKGIKEMFTLDDGQIVVELEK